MKAEIYHKERNFRIDLSKPLDISMVLKGDETNAVAWYLGPPRIEPVRDGNFTGSVQAGASTNFNNIDFNPHAHATHTECVGHITKEFFSINEQLKQFFFLSKLISIAPVEKGPDKVIARDQLEGLLQGGEAEALVLRTLPNDTDKCSRKYSHTNWPYLEEDAALYIRDCGVKHLLVDIPSVDKEKDGGKLLAHKAFWDYPRRTRYGATITELIYVPDNLQDGMYMLNLQPASFENDAAPSKPVLYLIEQL